MWSGSTDDILAEADEPRPEQSPAEERADNAAAIIMLVVKGLLMIIPAACLMRR